MNGQWRCLAGDSDGPYIRARMFLHHEVTAQIALDLLSPVNAAGTLHDRAKQGQLGGDLLAQIVVTLVSISFDTKSTKIIPKSSRNVLRR